MGALVGVDAYIVYSTDGSTWNPLPERNEFSLSVKADVAEHKVFVTSIANAWSNKLATWKSWSGSINGYYSDAENIAYQGLLAGKEILLRFYELGLRFSHHGEPANRSDCEQVLAGACGNYRC